MISAHSEGLGVGQEGKQMSLDEVMKHLEFILYPALIEGQFRKSCASLSRGLNDRVFDFVIKLKTKNKTTTTDVHLSVGSAPYKTRNSHFIPPLFFH